MRNVIISIVYLLMAIVTCMAIRCFICNSEINPECRGDAFENRTTHIEALKRNKWLRECEVAVNAKQIANYTATFENYLDMMPMEFDDSSLGYECITMRIEKGYSCWIFYSSNVTILRGCKQKEEKKEASEEENNDGKKWSLQKFCETEEDIWRNQKNSSAVCSLCSVNACNGGQRMINSWWLMVSIPLYYLTAL